MGQNLNGLRGQQTVEEEREHKVREFARDMSQGEMLKGARL